jgi:hypothetical protein
MRAVWLSVVLAACACDASSRLSPVELDVVVDRSGVNVHPRELHPLCTGDQWPTLGNCTPLSDAISCDDETPPSSCMAQLAVKAENGGIITEVQDTLFHNVFLSLAVPGSAASLIVDRCGQHADIPLPMPVGRLPVVLGATRSETSFQLTWELPEDHTSVVMAWTTGFGGERCHVAAAALDTQGELSGWQEASQSTIVLEALRPAGTFDTEIGEVTVWAQQSIVVALHVPGLLDDGQWSLSAKTWRADVFQEDFSYSPQFFSAEADLLSANPDTTVRWLASEVEFTAGPIEDRLTIGVSDPFVATFPHIIPMDGLDPGTPDDRYVLHIPETTATRASDGATTVISLELDWNLGLVALPIM